MGDARAGLIGGRAARVSVACLGPVHWRIDCSVFGAKSACRVRYFCRVGGDVVRSSGVATPPSLASMHSSSAPTQAQAPPECGASFVTLRHTNQATFAWPSLNWTHMSANKKNSASSPSGLSFSLLASPLFFCLVIGFLHLHSFNSPVGNVYWPLFISFSIHSPRLVDDLPSTPIDGLTSQITSSSPRWSLFRPVRRIAPTPSITILCSAGKRGSN